MIPTNSSGGASNANWSFGCISRIHQNPACSRQAFSSCTGGSPGASWAGGSSDASWAGDSSGASWAGGSSGATSACSSFEGPDAHHILGRASHATGSFGVHIPHPPV
ncbi:uncharacterized protein LOC119570098 [Penaeus monodon]|uniref:uncharacterized protein LOC119570098 n=1 Tax=Penaeus monodon TaxID=6687 RepID=UPI0018A7086F|nr:uncharacterized protein LOC119570098 [Penaeus monodon]